MKSYKCEYCNLTNWTDVIVCKRCQMPNPYLPEHEGLNDNQYVEEPTQQQFQQETIPQMAPPQEQYGQNQVHQHNLNYGDPNQPPPPNVYGQRAGSTNLDEGFSHNQIYDGGGFQEVIPNDVNAKFEEALENINKAYKAGRAYCILTVVLSLLVIIVFVLIAGAASSNSQATPSGAAGFIAFAGVLLFVVLAVVIGIVYGLSRGVRNKSKACAVILVVLFGIGLLSNLLTLLVGNSAGQSIFNLLISGIFTYYFALGVKGTFAYHKIVERYPSLKQ